MDAQFRQAMKNQKGFTLVEISLVLVIIGLLLGGVLKGQELINSAKIKSDTSTLVALQAGSYAYQDRVGTLPGVGVATTATTTTSPGQIPTTNSGSVETDAFFDALNAQGFISVANVMSEYIPSAYYIAGYGGSSASATTGLAVPNKNQICMLTNSILATGTDTKLDDGVATTGSVRSIQLTTAVGDATHSVCIEL